MRDQFDKVHESAEKNISYVQAKQAKNYDACHIRKLLSVSTKVNVKDKTREARKGDKLKVHSKVPTLSVRHFPKAIMISGTNMRRDWSTSSVQVT